MKEVLKEINSEKKCFIVDVKAKKEAKVTEVPFKVYKPIEIWKCKSIDEAIEKCEKNSEKSSWVYLEIQTDRYIREDEIKTMKSLKDDILEIIPKIKSEENEDEEVKNFSEKTFEEIFKEFYKKERDVEPDEELVKMLLSIVEGEEDNETN